MDGRHEPSRDARTAHLAIGTVFLANGVGFGSWAARIPSIKDRLGLDDAQLGVALLAAGIGALLSMPLAGAATARLGSRTTTWVAACAYAAALALPGLAGNLGALFAALLLLGAANGALDVCMNAQGVIVEQRRGRPILSGMHALWSLGGLFGAGLGALAATRLDPASHLLATALLIGVVFLAVGRLLLGDRPDEAGDTLFARPSRRLVGLGIVTFLGLFAEGAVGDWSAVYLHESLDADVGVAALAYAAFSLTMVVGRLAGDRVTIRLGPVVVLSGGLALAGAGLALAVVTAAPVPAIAGFGVMGLGLAAVVPVAFRAASETPGVASGAAVAGVSTLGYLGFLLGPPAIGAASRAVDLPLTLGIVAALLLVSAPLARAALRSQSRVPQHAG